MANLIQIPYEQLNAVSSKATSGLIDKYKKILFNKKFQKRVMTIRKSFFYHLHLDTALEEDIERNILLETDNIDLAIDILLRQFRLSDEWIYPVREFLEHNRLVLPKKDIQDYSDKSLEEIPNETIPETIVKAVYDDGKVRILLRSDHIERGNHVIPNPKILIELHAEAVNEDINTIETVVTKIRNQYQQPLSQHPNTSIPIEVCNAVWIKKEQNDLQEQKDRKQVQDMLEEIKDEFDFPVDTQHGIRKVMTRKNFERAIQVAKEQGF